MKKCMQLKNILFSIMLTRLLTRVVIYIEALKQNTSSASVQFPV